MGLEENDKRICLNQMFIWGQLMLISVTVFFFPIVFIFSYIVSSKKYDFICLYKAFHLLFPFNYLVK